MTSQTREVLKQKALREVDILKIKENQPIDNDFETVFDNLLNIMAQGRLGIKDIGITEEKFARFSNKRFGYIK
ncbi:hypothetical protein KJ885_02030 [Patescibacteria group bacterium]|nr:hypothetical protein [Patescibacteria group bacterium]